MPKNSHCVSYRWHVKCHAHMVGYAVFFGWLLWLTMKLLKNEKLWRSMHHLKTTMSWDNSRRQSHLPKPSYFEWVNAALVIPKLCRSGLAFKNGCPLMFSNYVACCCFQTILYEDIELSAPTPSEPNSPERPQPATLTTLSTHELPKPTLSQPQSHYVLIVDEILLIMGMVANWIGLAGRISLL